ncbi:MAG: hypothetical protein WDO06_03655 [Actinomycetota bacterium]
MGTWVALCGRNNRCRLAVTLTSGWGKHLSLPWSRGDHGLLSVGELRLLSLEYSIRSPLVLLFLAIAGGSDMVSAFFRSAIWNQTIPDHLRGRLAGINLLSYSIGPLSGQLRAATMAVCNISDLFSHLWRRNLHPRSAGIGVIFAKIPKI